MSSDSGAHWKNWSTACSMNAAFLSHCPGPDPSVCTGMTSFGSFNKLNATETASNFTSTSGMVLQWQAGGGLTCTPVDGPIRFVGLPPIASARFSVGGLRFGGAASVFLGKPVKPPAAGSPASSSSAPRPAAATKSAAAAAATAYWKSSPNLALDTMTVAGSFAGDETVQVCGGGGCVAATEAEVWQHSVKLQLPHTLAPPAWLEITPATGGGGQPLKVAVNDPDIWYSMVLTGERCCSGVCLLLESHIGLTLLSKC